MKTKKFYATRRTASDSINERRTMLYNRYMEKYRILWTGAYEWGGLPLATAHYVMRKFWEYGTVASFAYDIPGDPKLIDFTPWAMFDYNSHRDPSRITLTNENNAKYFPTGVLEVVYGDAQMKTGTKKAVIGYAQSNGESIWKLCDDYVRIIVDVEMALNTALIASKQPFLVNVSPENKAKADDLISRLVNDDPMLFVDGDELKGFVNGSPFIIDKLYQYKNQRESELLTYLGIDNVAIEKKERETLDEVNGNNDEINDHENSINENLEEFVKLTNLAFGSKLAIKARHAPSVSVHEDDKKEGNDNVDS